MSLRIASRVYAGLVMLTDHGTFQRFEWCHLLVSRHECMSTLNLSQAYRAILYIMITIYIYIDIYIYIYAVYSYNICHAVR